MAVLSGEIDSESPKIALVKKSTATCYPGLIALVTRYTQRGYRLRRMSSLPLPQGEDWGEGGLKSEIHDRMQYNNWHCLDYRRFKLTKS